MKAGEDRKALGRWGERCAADFLRKKGYRIVAANESCRFGELDLIAEDREYLVFAEVKLRKNPGYGAGREFVTAAKQRRIILAAEYWLSAHPTEKQPRFDVIEIYGKYGVIEHVSHIENAFTL